jgi:hypothetical protein
MAPKAAAGLIAMRIVKADGQVERFVGFAGFLEKGITVIPKHGSIASFDIVKDGPGVGIEASDEVLAH